MRTKKYIVEPGKQAARPLVLGLDWGRNPAAAWWLELGEGWNYDTGPDQSDWLKACGETFNPVKRNQNTVMLGIRYYKGRVEASPYYNVNGNAYGADVTIEKLDGTKPDWPVLEVDPFEPFYFAYRAVGARVTCTLIQGDRRLLHRFVHEGVGCIQSEVNFYFGGSAPAPNRISLYKRKVNFTEWGEDGGLII